MFVRPIGGSYSVYEIHVLCYVGVQ